MDITVQYYTRIIHIQPVLMIEHKNIETVNNGCITKPALMNNINTTSMKWSIQTYTNMVQAIIKAIGGKKGCTIMDIRKYVCANYMVEDTETISNHTYQRSR